MNASSAIWLYTCIILIPERLSYSNSSGDENDHEEPNDMESVDITLVPKQTRSGKNYQTIPIIPVLATQALRMPVMNAKTKHATLLKDKYPVKRDCKIPKNE